MTRVGVLLAGLLLVAVPADAAPPGKMRICLASDFDWTNTTELTVPENLVFEDLGRFYGSLTQAGEEYREMRGRANPAQQDGETIEGAVATASAIRLTKGQPCAIVPAHPVGAVSGATALFHHLWVGRRAPGGSPPEVTAALEHEQLRAMVITDLTGGASGN